jgi:hypothetical protein
MKSSLFLSLLLLPLLSFAETPAEPEIKKFEFICATNPGSTSFAINSDGTTAKFTMIHHNGAEYSPVHRGLVTQKDTDILLYRGRLIQKLGDYVEMQWPASNCSVSDDYIIRCVEYGRPEEEINGYKVVPYSLNSEHVIEKTSIGKFEKINADLDIVFEGISLNIPLSYSKSDCYFNLEPNSEAAKLKRIAIGIPSI